VDRALLQNVRAVIFDVDGTLYSQRRLRQVMLPRLFRHYAARPHRVLELIILQTFRNHREHLADIGACPVSQRQYADVARKLRCNESLVRDVVERWILTGPLAVLASCRFDGVVELFDFIRASGRQIAVLSDYPVGAKLGALDLTADVAIASTDSQVEAFKPDPRGLSYALRLLGVPAHECLLVGDRGDRDGRAARTLGVRYVEKGEIDQGHVFSQFRTLLGGLSAQPAFSIDCR
jgi:FMN phosphatase YigB (HAD superfamily)